MSVTDYADAIIEVIPTPFAILRTFFTFVNLKIFFVLVIVVSFIIMTIGKNHSRMGFKGKARKIFVQWTDDKRRKFQELSKRSVDIKDFTKYKSSDVENITLLNTFINAYISKVYEEIKSNEAANTNSINKNEMPKKKLEDES